MSSRVVIDWPAIKLAYLSTNISVRELAERFGVKEDTVWKRITRERWADQRVEFEQKAFAEAAGELAKKRVQELQKFNEDDLKIARAIRAKVAKKLGSEDTHLTSGELRMIAATAEAAQRMGRLALGASTENMGVGGPGGEGPVPVTNVSKEDYVKARQEILDEF